MYCGGEFAGCQTDDADPRWEVLEQQAVDTCAEISHCPQSRHSLEEAWRSALVDHHDVDVCGIAALRPQAKFKRGNPNAKSSTPFRWIDVIGVVVDHQQSEVFLIHGLASNSKSAHAPNARGNVERYPGTPALRIPSAK